MTMQIILNGKAVSLAQDTKLIDLLQQQNFSQPYAVALNKQFIAKQQYEQIVLQANDKVEVVQPIVGG